MTCTYCGTVLPAGALFCGECGRALAPAKAMTGRVSKAPVPVERPLPVANSEADRPKTAGHPASGPDGLHCEHCAAAMSADDIFCGECGFVSLSASEDFGRSRDTTIIEPLVEPLGIPPAPVAASAPIDDSAIPEATGIARADGTVGRFVLQFSTGESLTVYGTGLVGRNPQPEPGEFFDQLVRVFDPSRSVSKTHLEFGQQSGAFWVRDRYSGNGTVIREPDSAAVRCHPEKRFPVARGTRVEIGEQFFIVS